ncbi:uncharacterized protein LOC109713063 [Ananas comosus]|uniref:Uncharacterized protein LOC109713063 n=1 Tax=Ananas comosus TaxID=4615 RepID=A0A6P5F8U6_ANACO|nr:uncharacterized protein LOC109713063 [Ananas comosus]
MSEEATERGIISPTPINSRAKADNGSAKPIPHYLKPSSGSCHDFCKYGHKHGFDTKKRIPVHFQKGNNTIKIPEREKDQLIITSHKGRRKREEVKPKISSSEDDRSIKSMPLPPEKVYQLFDPPMNLAEAPAEAPLSTDLSSHTADLKGAFSLGNTPPDIDGGSSEEAVSIKLVIPSTIQKSDALDKDARADSVGSSDENLSIKSAGEGLSEEHVSLGPITEYVQEAIVSAELNGTAEALVKNKGNQMEETPRKQAAGLSMEKKSMKVSNSSDLKKPELRKPKVVEKIEGSDKAKTTKKKNGEEGEFGRNKIAPSPLKRTLKSFKETSNNEKTKKSPSSVKSMIASVKSRVNENQSLSSPTATDLSVKRRSFPKPETSVVKTKLSSISLGGQASRKSLAKKTTEGEDEPDNGQKDVRKQLKPSIPVKAALKSVSSIKLRKYNKAISISPTKNQRELGRLDSRADNIKEKTLHVIDWKLEKTDIKIIKKKSFKDNFSSPARSSLLASSSKPAPSISSRGKEVHGSVSAITEVSNDLKGVNIRKLRRSASVISDDNLTSPHKMKFRRGKVVNIQSENNGPRRLKFRKPRVVGENQNTKGEVEGRNFIRRRESAAVDSSTSEAPIIVLRHQDVLGKKDSQGLFNHVIEETASKLVETRKSKVKALVGAFETVILLQESKSVPTAEVP